MLQRDVVIVGACRTPSGRRGGGLSGMHPSLLLGFTQRAVLERAGVGPEVVGQVVGGCIGQVGAQSANVTRNAWLTEGLPLSVPSTTIDSQCGSSQQAAGMAASLIAEQWKITREDLDQFGLRSQTRPAKPGTKAASTPKSSPSTPPSSGRTGNPPARPSTSPATKACGIRPSRRCGASSRS